MKKIPWVAEDDYPDIPLIVKENGAVKNVTGCTVKLILKNADTGVVTNTSTSTCALTSPTVGSVTYTPHPGDFPIEGTYFGDIQVTFPGGRKRTYYKQAEFDVRAHN